MPEGRESLYRAATSGFDRIPPSAWTAAIAAAVLMNGLQVAALAGRALPDWADIPSLLVQMAAWFGAIYLAAMGLIGRQATAMGFVRYVVTVFATALPFCMGVSAPMVAGPQTASFVVGLAFMLVGVALLVLLPAWQVAQSLTPRMVSPLRALRATHGHRGALVTLGLCAGVLGNQKLVPAVDTATDLQGALALAGGRIALAVLCFAATSSIAANAWRFAVRNDPDLDPTPRDGIKTIGDAQCARP